MSRQERHYAQYDHDRFWTEDIELDEGALSGFFFDDVFTVRAHVHLGQEQYHGRGNADIVSLAHQHGTRAYVLMHPYILVPDTTLEVDLEPHSSPSGAIGTVRSSTWEGLRHDRTGDAQAWVYYPDRLIMLWEVNLRDQFAGDDLLTDGNRYSLWRSFEKYLVGRFPIAERIVTPSWEPGYEPENWQAFLAKHSYEQVNDRAFGKVVGNR